MANSLTDLVKSLKVIPIVPRDIIAVLKKIDASSFQQTDNLVASCAITVITIFPEVMEHANNNALKRLCLKLKPTEISLSDTVRQEFYLEKPTRKPRMEIKRKK